MAAEESSIVLVYVIVGSGTVVYFLCLGVGSRTVAPGSLGRDIVLATSIWRTGLWFLVVVDWIHILWVVVMNLGILGLVYHGVGARNVAHGVLGRNILLAMLIWRTGLGFL